MPPARVARLVDALDHLGAAPERDQLARSGELTAPPALVREALKVAIDEAADALSGHSTLLLRGTGSPAQVRAGVEEMEGLLDLLEGVEGGAT